MFEAESLKVLDATRGIRYGTISEAASSDGQAVQLYSQQIGDFINFLAPKVPAGNYEVRMGIKKWKPRAIVQTRIGDAGGKAAIVGPRFDQFSSGTTYMEADLGNWTAANTGDKQFRFVVMGKNPMSSGFTMVIDYIKLIPQ